MPTTEHLAGQWREWRHQRIATLTRPYGWTSLVAQHWLHDDDTEVRLDDLPGSWSIVDGRVIHVPDPSGPRLSVDGEYVTGPVEIVAGRNMVYSDGDSVPVYFGECEVDTIVRTNDDGQRIYAVRKRDPRQAASVDLSSLSAFEYDPAWRVPATFEPMSSRDEESVTVEAGVRETTSFIGVLHFELEGQRVSPLVTGKDSPSGVQPVLHIRDLSSADVTYGAGRTVDLEFADDAGTAIEYVDLNYLVALPCAFTNFVTCPLPPPENQLGVRILAGEKRPATTVDRVSTYVADEPQHT